MLSWIWAENVDNGKENKPITKDDIKFTIEGKEHTVQALEINPETTLNDYLRHKSFLTGTKRMCYEGGCGSCVVAVTRNDDEDCIAVNSCLVSILTCHGWKIETIEGIGNPVAGYNPIQKALANFNGTQCGFCSPGMVMNMYALCKDGKPTSKEVENSFGGNICRCTGYRPILTAFKSLCSDASTDLLGTYPDIEDFVFIKAKNKVEEIAIEEKYLSMNSGEAHWWKVLTLRALLSKLATINGPYMLVAGNTAKGVYKFPKPTFYIDIMDVKELKSYELKNNILTVGGNMSLTNTIKIFNQVAQLNPKFAHLKKMAEHIDLIANVPVRNIGTLAGNLMIKHFKREFPSDIFLLLETFSATLSIVDTNGRVTKMGLPNFLKYDMTKKVIQAIQLPSLSSDFKYETFKIMPRAQNAHAIVNAGIVFGLDKGDKVKNARIVFGNISPEFIHATRTEQFLIGRELFNNSILQAAFKVLSEELVPEDKLPEPSGEFRKELAIGLFYKGILSIAPMEKLSPSIRSGGAKLERPVSNGVQDYETNESLYPLTKAIPKLEALAQTSGQAQYIDDIPDLPTQLFGKFILAQAAAGSNISNIDASQALALKGVVRFFTKDDIPGDNNFIPAEFGIGVIERVFCDTTIEYYHQPVGLLVASDRDILSEAAKLIKVSYTTPPKKPYLTIKELLKAKATDRLMKEQEIKPIKTGTDITRKISGTFDIQGQYHFHMELQCCLAVPTEDGMDMYPSTQWMDLIQAATAKVLKIPQNKININVRRCGGAFGAKISRNSQVSCAAGLAAWLLKKPVRISLTLKENMELIGKRFPFFADYEVDVNDAGVIQHFTTQMYSDHGVGGNESGNKDILLENFRGNYNNDPVEVTYYRTKTDMPANTWTRAPGAAEGIGYFESVMDHIASEVGLDPLDVRLNNITNTALVKYLGDLKEWADVDQRKQDILKFNKENRWKKRGISTVPMAWQYLPAGPLTATVSIYHVDGSVTISHGGIEIGQGINTKAAQVCAYKFNIPLEKVNVYPSNSMVSANCTTTGGSVTSEGVCYAVDKACDELLLRLKPYRNENSAQTWEELIQAAFKDIILLTTNAQYSPNEPFIQRYPVYGSCATEVEVDILTGQHQLRRVDLIVDVGTSLSPFVDIGQIEGAFIMGAGYYTSEKLVYDENGKMLTNNTWTYKPPGAKDIPVDFRLKLPKNNPNPVGVLQSKAVGEPAFCLSVGIPLAIRTALASARTDSDPTKPKFFFFDGPTNIENTFMNSLNDYKQYKL